jgi:chitinase
MSYAEIQDLMKMYNIKPQYDEKAGIKYMIYRQDQWVSFDDAQTLQVKVDYADKQG